MLFTAKDIVGRQLHDQSGRTIGRITAFYRYPTDFNAPWGVAVVTHGRLIRSTRLVDLQDAILDQDAIVAAYRADTINAAPNDPTLIGDMLADEHASQLRVHYRGTSAPA